MMDIDKNKITLVFLGILVLVAVGVVLKYAATVVLPLIIAWLLSFLLAPVVNYMTARKVPTTLAVFIILIILLGVIYLSGTFLYTRITAFAAAYPRYHSRMTELIATFSNQLNLSFDPLAGYVFAKFRFPGREPLFLVILGTLMIPFFLRMIPMYWVTIDR